MSSQERFPASEESLAIPKHRLELQEFLEFQDQVSRIIAALQEEIDAAKEEARQKIAGLLANIAMPTAITVESIAAVETSVAHQAAEAVQDMAEAKPSQPSADEALEDIPEVKPSRVATDKVARTKRRVPHKVQNRMLAIIETNRRSLTNTEALEVYNQLYVEDPTNYSNCSNALATLAKRQLIQKPARGVYKYKEPESPQQQPENTETSEQITSRSVDLENNRRQERILDMGALLLLRIRTNEIRALLEDRNIFSGVASEIIEHRQEWDLGDSQRLDIEQISQIFSLSEDETQEIEHQTLDQLNCLFEERHGQTVKSILLNEEAGRSLESLDAESREEFMMRRQHSKILLAERLLAIKGCRNDWYKLIKTALWTHCSVEQSKVLDSLYGLTSFVAHGGVTQTLSVPSAERNNFWQHKREGLLNLCEGAELENRESILGKIPAIADAHLDAQVTDS